MKMTPARMARMKAEYDFIVETLKKTNFSKCKAADLLGVDRKTIYNKLKRYKHFAGIDEVEKQIN